MFAQRVHVGAHSATKESRLLRNDAQPGAQVPKANGGDVQPIDQNAASTRLHQPEQSTDQSGLQ